MRIYNPEPQKIMRVTISHKGEKNQTINFVECTQIELLGKLTEIINSQNISPINTGNLTRLDIRECIGSENGKNKSISLKGIGAEKLYKIIKTYFDPKIK